MFHRVGAHLVAFARLTEAQLGLPALLCALGGLVLAAARPARHRALGVVLALVLVGDALYSAALNPMAIDDLQDGHPTALVIAIAAGAGVLAAGAPPRAARRAVGRRRRWPCSCASPPRSPTSTTSSASRTKRGNWTRAALAEAPPRARVLVESDDLAAGTTYEQFVAGERPDVLVLVRQHAVGQDGGGARACAAPTRAPGDERAPLLWEPGTDPLPSPIVPDVPLYRAYVDAPLPPARPLAERIAALLAPARDPTVRIVECEALVALGRVYLARGDAPRANALFETALAVRPGDAPPASTSRSCARAAATCAARSRSSTPCWRAIPIATSRASTPAATASSSATPTAPSATSPPRTRSFAGAAAPLVGLARVAAARGDRPAAQRWLRAAEKTDSSDADVRTLHKELER